MYQAKKKIFPLLLISFLFSTSYLTPPPVYAKKKYEQLIGVVDIRSTYSDGDFSVEELVDRAKNESIDILIITDHDRMVFQYGLFPFRSILKYRVERPSVLKNGVEKYLARLDELDQRSKEVIIIPGVESAPFYYWSGLPLPGKLTLHDWEKHLLVIGIEKPEKLEGLPILHSNLSVRYFKDKLPKSILYSLPFLASLWLLFHKKKRAWWSCVILALTLLLMLNNHPFSSSLYDPYHGSQGIQPYQELIDYVNSCGGMSFWTHPETNTGVRDLGIIKVNTPPHREDLLKAENYTGFAAVYGDIIKATDPGREWDQILNDYCLGKRERPSWGISSSDYHNEHPAPFGTYVTTFLVKTRNKSGVLEALRAGRMYNYIGPEKGRIILDRFEIEDPGRGSKAVMGETIAVDNSPLIRITALSDRAQSPQSPTRLSLKIIRSGTVCYEIGGNDIINLSWPDNTIKPGHIYYYRLDIKGSGRRMLSNPIFVKIKKRKNTSHL